MPIGRKGPIFKETTTSNTQNKILPKSLGGKGIRRAIAIGELKPGNAPTNTPIKTPDKIKSIF